MRPNFDVEHYVARALAGVLPACSASVHDEVATVLGGISSERLAARAQDYAHVLVAFRPDDLSVAAAEHLVNLASGQDDPIFAAHALGAGSRSPRAHALLEEQAANGNREALSLLDPAALPDIIIETVANQNTTLLATIIEEAENGSFARRNPDPAETLARLGVWHPTRIDWSALARYLAHPIVRGAFKRTACQLLADGADRLPADSRAMLAKTVGNLRDSPLDVLASDGSGLGAAQLMLSIALGVTDHASVPTTILTLLNGPARTRADAAILIGRTPHAAHLLPVLVGLGRDAEPLVRVGAAVGLAEHVVRTADSADPILVQALDDQLGVDGAQIAAAVAAVLGRVAPSTIVAPLVTRLLRHRSAQVRARISDRTGDMPASRRR